MTTSHGHKQPSRLVIMLGMLLGAGFALVAILLGNGAARLLAGEHVAAQHHTTAAQE
jgi:hypothetical protein